MNALKLNIAKTISKGNKLINRNSPMKNGQRILMYHSVRNFAKYEVSKNIYTLNPTLFIEQMKCLKDNFDGCIRQLEFDDLHSQQELTINITFDDGFKDNLKIVAPLMEELKIPFTVFVASDFLDQSHPLHLDKKELKELAAMSLVSIGSHSKSHANLTQLSKDQVKEELQQSKLILEDLIGAEVCGFSYPFGGVNRDVRDSVEELGYKYAVNSCFDLNQKIEDRFMLSRNEIWNTDTSIIFQEKIQGHWDWLKMNHKYKI
ncbi:polysaccharide deacetylase family protein [Gammaproteobacteria bacterium]|nr:polysaccharide deacetylase family protein [Gammaproteobacteria bacterium]MDB9859529.1 polysaccharide deacetylase family protein [Gammaproteobacteria bacterium]